MDSESRLSHAAGTDQRYQACTPGELMLERRNHGISSDELVPFDRQRMPTPRRLIQRHRILHRHMSGEGRCDILCTSEALLRVAGQASENDRLPAIVELGENLAR